MAKKKDNPIGLLDKTCIRAENEDSRVKLLTQLSQVRVHPGWKILKADIDFLIKETEGAIFTPGGNEIEYSYKDLQIIMRNFLLKLADRPDELRVLLQGSAEPTRQEEIDPFA